MIADGLREVTMKRGLGLGDDLTSASASSCGSYHKVLFETGHGLAGGQRLPAGLGKLVRDHLDRALVARQAENVVDPWPGGAQTLTGAMLVLVSSMTTSRSESIRPRYFLVGIQIRVDRERQISKRWQ